MNFLCCIRRDLCSDYPQMLQESKIFLRVVKSYRLTKGKDFSTSYHKAESDLTSEMVVSGSWRQKKFKPYNLDALGVPPGGGHLHPLLRVRGEFRQIFLEMGFTEMPTNNFTENSFWNFDALFQPQQHPARDAHDTFFVSSPRCSSHFPPEYLQKVKQIHSKGGYGSQGYGYDWKLEEAEKNLLRTHTTAVSARMLYLLAREGFTPSKYFSIDRVFRNETLDATHLAEFHQVEGVIADHNLTLGDLIGTLYEFFSKLGITQLQFKPAYNPYTEPSMEVFCYHMGLGKWIEVGNSGIFRPEMLLPMGLPEDVNVIAWGLSLERPTMIKYGLNNIRDLVGAKVNLQMVYDSPLCRLDKNEKSTAELQKQELRWDSIHLQLQALQTELQSLRLRYEKSKSYSQAPDKDLDFVILSDPRHPPYSLVVLLKLLLNTYRVEISEHIHSSVSDISSELRSLFKGVGNNEGAGCCIKVTLIWKMIGKDPLLTLSPVSNNNIVGEVNVARYLSRLLEQSPSPLVVYESQGELYASQVDMWLDCIYKSVIRGENKSALPAITAVLTTQCWLLGNSVSLADICLWSSLKQNPYLIASNSKLKKWYESCCKHAWFV
ncbi:phenylalanine--tRNA ligase alpha subunit-like isoform X2 [Periplaneta americana]|uniref:phenylalanine--tRNA ligase alpha subunit-like isoform X2 n=1 Tax=Periplaneta americana TaxID=6978 RepID=UPI0037E81085